MAGYRKVITTKNTNLLCICKSITRKNDMLLTITQEKNPAIICNIDYDMQQQSKT